MGKYIVYSNGRMIGIYDSFSEAIQVLAEIGGGEIYKGDLIVRLSTEEAHELKTILVSEPIEPPEAPVMPKRKVVVLDQMFKGFYPEVLSKKFPHIEIHVISGRGIDREVRAGNMVYHPADTDYDVAEVIKGLKEKQLEPIFFTGDKKLYNHVLTLGIKAYYLPPSEAPSKEALVEKMINIIKNSL